MPVQWQGHPDATGQNNRFFYKHLQVMEELPEDESSILTFAGILFRVRRFESPMIRAQGNAVKRQFYGAIKPGQNTVVITTPEGVETMETWIAENVEANGTYDLPVTTGYVAHYDGSQDVNSCLRLNLNQDGMIRVAIRVVEDGGTFLLC